MPAILLQLLLRALPLLAGMGGQQLTRGALTAGLSSLGKRGIGQSLLGGKKVGTGIGFLSELLGFAGGEALAEQIPGVQGTGQGFFERLPALAAGIGGGHLAAGGLRRLGGPLLKPGTQNLRFLPQQAAGLGGFIGGAGLAEQFLPHGSEKEEETAQEAQLLGSIDTGSITRQEEEQFLELISELQFQNEDHQGIDPQLIDQILNSSLGSSLV